MKTACCRGLDVLLNRGRSGRVLVGTVALDFLGIDAGKKYLTIHVDNPKGLVAKEKGEGIAWLTSLAVPEFVENKIYDTISETLKKEFAEKGSTVSVEIVSTPPKGEKPSTVTREGVFLGLLLAGLGYGVVKLVGKVL